MHWIACRLYTLIMLIKILELSRFFVDTRRNSQVEPPQDPQPSDVHEHDDDVIDEVQNWIEQEMLDDDDDGDDDEVNFEDEDDDEFNPAEIVCDPAHRQQIADYHPNIQDQVRRAYILKGPTRPTSNLIAKKLVARTVHFLKIGIRIMIG